MAEQGSEATTERKCRYYGCNEPAEPGKDFCIFHDPDPGKDKGEFKRRLKEQIEGKGGNARYSFDGYRFPDGWGKWTEILKDKTLEEDAHFRGARFEGNVDFSGIQFERDADFGNVEFIREIHRQIVRGDLEAGPGEYRKIQNYIVDSRTEEIVYTPPSAQDVPPMMAALVTWLNEEMEMNPILVAGIAQFQLVHIHPFLNGNGRTARLLSTLCLYRRGYDFKRLFTISEYYDRDRAAYYRALQSVRERGMDLTDWLEYFTEGLATQMREVQERGKRVIHRDVLAQEYRLSDRQRLALGYALEHGGLTIRDFEGLCPNISRRTLQRELKAMIERRLLSREGATNRLYYRLAREV